MAEVVTLWALCTGGPAVGKRNGLLWKFEARSVILLTLFHSNAT